MALGLGPKKLRNLATLKSFPHVWRSSPNPTRDKPKASTALELNPFASGTCCPQWLLPFPLPAPPPPNVACPLPPTLFEPRVLPPPLVFLFLPLIISDRLSRKSYATWEDLCRRDRRGEGLSPKSADRLGEQQPRRVSEAQRMVQTCSGGASCRYFLFMNDSGTHGTANITS